MVKATKLPPYLLKSPADIDKYFEEELKRLRTDYVDYYLIHALNNERFNEILTKYNCYIVQKAHFVSNERGAYRSYIDNSRIINLNDVFGLSIGFALAFLRPLKRGAKKQSKPCAFALRKN